MSAPDITTPGAAVDAPAAPVHPSWSALASRLTAQLAFNEDRFFLILAVFIGIFAGLAVVCFRITMEWTRLYLLGSALTPSPWRAFLAPSLTGLVISALIFTVFRGATGSGLNQTKAALYISNGYIPLRTVIGKFILATLAIGSGHSLGPEDPSLQIGAGLASAVGTRLNLSRKKLRILAPVGAAAGLAAAFNAPISAVLFVIEEVIGHWSAGILATVVLSAVSSVVTMRLFLGSEPFFRIPAVGVIRWEELLAYSVLGVLGGIASVVFAAAIGWLRPKIKASPNYVQYLCPAIAGLLLGLIAFLGFPQVMGAGYDFMDQAMHNQYTWQVLGILAGLKIVATTLSFTSGTPGGMFAPTLFIGAMLGGAVGTVEHLFFPNLTGSVGTYALVGMGVLFAGFLRAPITSIFMVLEVSGDYTIILAVLVANMFAYMISRRLQPVPALEQITRQDGLYLPALEEEREQEILTVEDAMRPRPAIVLDSQRPVPDAWTTIQATNDDHFLVRRPSNSVAVISRVELKGLMDGGDARPLEETQTLAVVPYLHPDEDLQVALRQATNYPLVPVLSRANVSRILGVIDLADIMEAYKKSNRPEPSRG
ncbi:MAG TPA: chloride channel protein [Candidatus Sulfotelmatobacter sp.]|nr:chloride channel protein [Candidatus Sulfotelmatobacter sp.]